MAAAHLDLLPQDTSHVCWPEASVKLRKQLIRSGQCFVIVASRARGGGRGPRRRGRPAAPSEDRHATNPTVGRVGLRRGQTKRILSSPLRRDLSITSEKGCVGPSARMDWIKNTGTRSTSASTIKP